MRSFGDTLPRPIKTIRHSGAVSSFFFKLLTIRSSDTPMVSGVTKMRFSFELAIISNKGLTRLSSPKALSTSWRLGSLCSSPALSFKALARARLRSFLKKTETIFPEILPTGSAKSALLIPSSLLNRSDRIGVCSIASITAPVDPISLIILAFL